MKKIIIMAAVLLIASFGYAIRTDISQTSYDVVNVRIEADYQSVSESDAVIEGTYSNTFALLAEDVEIVVNDITVSLYDSKGTLLETVSGNPVLELADHASRVYLSGSFSLREMYGFTINTLMSVEKDGYTSVVEKVDFDVVGIGTREIPASVSESFYHTYKQIADNYRSSYLVNLPFKQPAMLIISHNSLDQALSPYVRWKRELGMEVSIINKEDIAANATSAQIRTRIRQFYNNAENKPDYLVLIGDVGGNVSIPTFYHPPQNDATDLPYAVMSGEGFVPDVLVGRISVTSAYQLATIVNKTLMYEKTPHIGDWMDRALVVAGNFATTLPIPITPILTSRWIAELLRNTGYQVTEVYWEVGDGGYGTTQIADALNSGVQFVSYRGWGDANGWHYPQFQIRHLRDVQNGPRMPVVTSFVCNTGDFANAVIDPCFGEYWMRMGTPINPNGAVGFIGPSDLYTSTEYNNAMATGFYWGVMREGIRGIAAGLLRGKMEMYRNYPTERNPGQWLDHYFKVYNVISDPSMKMWMLRPRTMNVNIPATISSAASQIEFATPGLEGGYVTITRDHENYKVFRIDGENIFIPLLEENEDDIWITVSRENYIPVQQTIEVVPSTGVEMTQYNFGGSTISPGVEISLNVTLKNYGNAEVANVSAVLSAYTDEFVDIIDHTDTFGNIPANGSVNGSFTFMIHPETPRFTPIQLALNISPTNGYAKIQSIVGGLNFQVTQVQVDSENSVLDPGETAEIAVTIKNEGEVAASNVTAHIVSGSDAVEVQLDPLEFGNIGVGETGMATFTATAAADAFIGRQVYFQLDFEDEVGLITTSYFNITLGEVDNTAPTGPCPYGYYAYDSFDVDYEHAPVYDWVNIDPENGGPGEDMWLEDDETISMPLPFAFRYYGIEYEQISICSNGWVTLPNTWMINFRNWSIPSAENPYGIIAPFWDDLKGLDEVEYKVRIAWYHDEVNNRFIVSWLDAYNWANRSPSGLEQIQLILEPRAGRDGDIVFQYHTVWNQNQNRNYSTQGIQSPCNTMGLQYAFFNIYAPSASRIQAGLAIKFTTDAPDQYTSVDDVQIPSYGLALKQNYPNPFNPETVIEFSLPTASLTSLDIYNVRGQKIRTLLAQEMSAGNHQILWDGKDNNNREVGTGVYLYKLRTPQGTESRRMIMMK